MILFLILVASQIRCMAAITFPVPHDFASDYLSTVLSSECATTLRNMTTESRLKYLDAAGRPRSGILSGNTLWFGSFGNCLSHDNSRYCLTFVEGLFKNNTLAQSVRLGICVPDVCNENDIKSGLETIITNVDERLPLNLQLNKAVRSIKVKCYEKPSISSGVKCTIVLFSFILAFCFIGTVIDMVHETIGDVSVLALYGAADKSPGCNSITDNGVLKPAKDETSPLLGEQKPLYYSNGVIGKKNGLTESLQLSQEPEPDNEKDKKQDNSKVPSHDKMFEFFLCFSLLRNSRKVMSTDVSGDSISSLNGLRVISLFWVILGHIYVCAPRSEVIENPVDMFHDGERFSLMVISNGMFCVDTFLLLSGLLLAYNAFKHLKNDNGHINWALFYLHRYLRLTPTLMIVILFVAKIVPFLGKSPMWFTQVEQTNCNENWWTNMLYINNFYPTNLYEKMCISPTWYLAIDMQLFVITPMIIYIFCRYGHKGTFCLSTILILISSTITAILVNHYHIDLMSQLPSHLLHDVNNNEAHKLFNYIYTKPYCRVQPYIIGLVFGYLMHMKIFRAKTLGWPLALVCWSLSFGLGLVVVYGPYNTAKHHPREWSTAENVVFASVAHLCWGVAVAWVIYACEYGYGGYVKEFLSAKFWIPLSRLNYSAYLVHYNLIMVMFVGHRTGLHYTTELMVYYYCAALVLSYAIAFIVVVTVEYPCANIEMMIFKPKKTWKK